MTNRSRKFDTASLRTGKSSKIYRGLHLSMGRLLPIKRKAKIIPMEMNWQSKNISRMRKKSRTTNLVKNQACSPESPATSTPSKAISSKPSSRNSKKYRRKMWIRITAKSINMKIVHKTHDLIQPDYDQLHQLYKLASWNIYNLLKKINNEYYI